MTQSKPKKTKTSEPKKTETKQQGVPDITQEIEQLVSDPTLADPLLNKGILYINGEITANNMAEAIRMLLSLHLDPTYNDWVQIIIDSPGGDLHSGFAFIDVMNFIRLPVRTIVLGTAFSMGAFIFIAGTERIMAPNSMVMIHHYSSGKLGTYDALIAERKAEDFIHGRIIEHLKENSKYKTEEEIRAHLLHQNDNYLTPTEMLRHGLCDKIYKPLDKRALYKK